MNPTGQDFEAVFGFKPPRNTEIRAFIDEMAEQFPKLWEYTYPRFYRTSQDYVSAKLPAHCFFTAMLDVLGVTVPGGGSITEQVLFTTCQLLHRYRFPHFYVTPELFRAVSLSEPPGDLLWADLKLPYPAAIFMLPKGALTHPVNGPVAWLAYSRHQRGDKFDFVVDRFKLHQIAGNTAFSVVFEAYAYRPMPPAFHIVLNDDVNPHVAMTDIQACFDEKGGAQVTDSHILSIPLVEGEEKFSEMAASLVFRLLLAMQARPQLAEPGHFTGKRLSSAHRPEIWDPNLVGRTYHIRREAAVDGNGGGWHLRMHWRRGHYRQQPHGPKHELRKIVWIEPYMAGGDEGAE